MPDPRIMSAEKRRDIEGLSNLAIADSIYHEHATALLDHIAALEERQQKAITQLCIAQLDGDLDHVDIAVELLKGEA